jgi:hypothetical protein
MVSVFFEIGCATFYFSRKTLTIIFSTPIIKYN